MTTTGHLPDLWEGDLSFSYEESVDFISVCKPYFTSESLGNVNSKKAEAGRFLSSRPACFTE